MLYGNILQNINFDIFKEFLDSGILEILINGLSLNDYSSKVLILNDLCIILEKFEMISDNLRSEDREIFIRYWNEQIFMNTLNSLSKESFEKSTSIKLQHIPYNSSNDPENIYEEINSKIFMIRELCDFHK